MRKLIRYMAYTMMYKRIHEKNLYIRHISLESNAISYFNLSSNPIISFDLNGNRMYFRECPRLYRKTEYYMDKIDSFFLTLDHFGIPKEHFKQQILIRLNFSSEEKSMFKDYIDQKKKSRTFLKMLSNANRISDNIGFSIWENKIYNLNFLAPFGMDDINEKLIDISVYFLWYMRGASNKYYISLISKGKAYSFFDASKSICSYIVAEALGLEHLVTSAELCYLNLDNGQKLLGVLSPSAPGSRMIDNVFQLDGSLQHELVNLHTLDYICNQPDHGPNNYNIYQDGGIFSVCAFDNDNPRTFFPSTFINVRLSGCSPLIDSKGEIFLPYFDRDIAERILHFDFNDLANKLKPYLNFLQIRALKIRIKKFKKAIKKTKQSRKSFLINGDDWSAATAEHEVNGEYGITFLKRAMNKL